MPTNYNISITVNGHDNASKPLRGVSSALADMGKIAGGIQLSQVFDSIVGGMRNLGESAISAAAQFQGLGIAMETLSARELVKGGAAVSDALSQAGAMADEYMKKLEEISLISPYEWNVVSDMSRLQMAFGAGQDEALDLTRALLDTSAGLGLTRDAANRLAYNFGQIRMVGKVLGTDLRQLRMVGLDLADVFQSQLGMSIDQVNTMLEAGRMTMQDVSAAFMQYAQQNFGGAAEKMSRTLMGIQSSFSDLFTFAARDLLTPALDRIAERVVKIFDFTQALSKSGLFKEIGVEFAGWVEGMLVGVEQLVSRVGSEGLVGVLGLDEGQVRAFIAAALELAGALSGYVGQAFDFVRAHANEFKGALLGIGAALAAGAIVGGVLALVGAIMGLVTPIGLVIAAAALLGAAWTGNWGGIQEKTAVAVAVIKQMMADLEVTAQNILARMTQWWQEHGDSVERIAKHISDLASSIWQFMQSDPGIEGTQTRWESLWDMLLLSVENFVGNVLDQLGAGVDLIDALLSGDFGAALTALGDAIVGSLRLTMPGIDIAWAGLSTALQEPWENATSSLVEFLNGTAERIADALNGAWEGAKEKISDLPADMLHIGADLIGGLIQGIEDSAGQLLTAVKEKITDPLPEWVKGPLGIQSPSIVFRDVGMDIINGLLFGIEAKQPNLLAKMKEVESNVSASADRLAALKDGLAAGAGGGIPDKVMKQMQSGIGGILGMPSGNDFIRANLAGTSQDLGDAWDEQARRMADVAAQGKSSPWIGMFDIPADIMDAGGNTLKAYAMQWQTDFYAGLKPDQVNSAAVIDQYAQQLQAQLAQQQLTGQITTAAMQDPNIMGLLGQLTGSPLQTLGTDATALTSLLPALNPLLSETMSLATGGANAAGGVAGAAAGAAAAVTSPLGQMNLDITALQGLLGPVGEQLTALWDTISTKVNEALRQTHTILSKNLIKSISDAKVKLDEFTKGFDGVRLAVDALCASIAVLLDLIEQLRKANAGNLDPGSPTPFELGLRGINRELGKMDMSVLAVPDVGMPVLGPPATSAAGTSSAPLEVHLHVGAMLGRESEAREFALKLAPLINEAQKVYGAG